MEANAADLLERESALVELTTERDALIDSLRDLENKNSSTSSDLAALTSQRKLLQANISSLLDDIDGVKTEKADADGKVAALETERNNLSSQREVIIKERDYLLEQLEAERTASASSADRVEELQGEASNAEAEIASLNDQLAALTASQADAQNEASDLRTLLGNAEAALASAKSQIEEQTSVRLSNEDALFAARQRAQDIATAVSADLRAAGVNDASVAVRGDNTVGIRVASGSLFGTGSSKVSASGGRVLATVGANITGYNDYDIRVEGHTDNVPIGPVLARTFKSNWELSVARAASAVRFLSENGVDASRLSAVGYGEFSPIADNSSASGREQNRRVEVVLHPK